MKILEGVKEIVTGKKPLIDVYHYLLGNYRYELYYSGYAPGYRHPLMRKHIFEQIAYRISVMNKECYMKGSCIKCGCNTTELQMANKRCDGICYPTMMNKKDWEQFKQGRVVIDGKKDGAWIAMTSIDGKGERLQKHIFYKETNNSYVPVNKN